MKGPKNRFFRGGIPVWCAATLALVSGANAQVIHLSDNNSDAYINLNGTGTGAGMTNWTVSGINQLSQQWFWFRAGGMTSEQMINSLGTPVFTQLNARTLYTSYFDVTKGYGVSVNYLLTGGSGSNPLDGSASDIAETISITNGTAAPLEFHFFQYSAFQLGGDSGDMSIRLGKNLRGLYNEATVTKTNLSYTFAVSETVVSPGAARGEVDLFNGTLGRLSDGSATILNNNNGPVASAGGNGPTWAFQWDFIIAPGSSVGISKDKFLQYVPTPEPSTAALLGLGAATAIILRRRRS